MKRILAIALSALMLSGCVAEWKNPRGPQRWKDQPGVSNPGTASGQAGGNPVQP